VELTVEKRGDGVVVAHLSGEMTGGDAGELTDQLLEHAVDTSSAVAIEMSGLASLDSTGLSALITLVARARMSQGEVKLVAPSPLIRGILEVTRLDKYFVICNSLEEL